MKRVIIALSLCIVLLAACSNDQQDDLSPLPPPERDGGPFGVDVNINMSTIDNFLNRPDVAYFDMRMFYDPADYEAIGGISNLTETLPGFRVVPFPYLASIGALPVDGAYDGETLFDVVWGEGRGEILSIAPNYLESEAILNDIFPKDKVIFLMCGGAGYTSLTRGLLVHFGWDENMIYHTGGNWYYEGSNSVDMTVAGGNNPDDPVIATWRVNYAHIDFSRLTPVR
jgi:hypothetical protein